MKTFKQLIEQIQVDEVVRITDKSRAKYDRNFGQKGTFQGDTERKHLAAAAKDRRNKTQGSGVSGFNSKLTGRSSTQDTGSVRAIKTEDYDIESMLEYIEELEYQLDEISQKTKQNYLDVARPQKDDIYAKHGLDPKRSYTISQQNKAKETMTPDEIKTVDKRSSGIAKAQVPLHLRLKSKKAMEKYKNMSQAEKDELESKARGYGSGRYQGD